MDRPLEVRARGRWRLPALANSQASTDARIATLAESLQALSAQSDRFLCDQQGDGHE
jgi:hypothetical protein